MRNRLLILAMLPILAACSVQLPDFLGREGTGETIYTLRGDPLPDSVPVPLDLAALERSGHGVILRAAGAAPRQGYHTADLMPVETSRAGVVGFRFMAIPPEGPSQVGPPQTRTLTAAVFVPNRALRGLTAFEVAGVASSRTLPLP